MVRKVLEEASSPPSFSSDASSSTPHPRWPAPDPNDALFKSATSRFFCGQARNDSPFGTNAYELDSVCPFPTEICKNNHCEKKMIILPCVCMCVHVCLYVCADAKHQPFISPSEAAIIESMVNGGSHLSLKAHFVDQLPVLTPLAHTLVSLNLSYNSLKVSKIIIAAKLEVSFLIRP